MRIYYIFNIKKEVYEIYKNTPSVLYNFFYQLYINKNDDLNYGSSIFKQVSSKFNNELLNLKIYLKLHNKMKYLKRNDEHIINNLYKNEISIMKIKKSYIIINSNSSYTDFFPILNNLCKYLFVCDFNNQDYFYLANLKMLV